MITKLRVSNFYSIGELVELDFIKGGKTEEDGYFLCRKGKVSTVNGFFGANASGKSTFLRAMYVLVKIIYNKNPLQALGFNATDKKFFSPNLHSSYKDKISHLGFDILLANKLYKYDVEVIDGSQIQKETLYVMDLNIKSYKDKEVFTRANNKIEFGTDYKNHNAFFSVVQLPDTQTLLSQLIESFPAGEDFRNYKDKFFVKPDDLNNFMAPPFVEVIQRALTIDGQEDAKKKKEMVELTSKIMSRFDKTIKNVKINTENNNINVTVEHEGFYEDVGIMRESAGTRELFTYIYDIVNVFSKGGIVLYDETNRYFHPDIENIIISLFKESKINTSNAQLFFASHNHDTLNLLNLDQIFIVEKENHNSTTYKVSDIKDVKSRDNLKKKYNLGSLGGTPDVIDFKHTIQQFI